MTTYAEADIVPDLQTAQGGGSRERLTQTPDPARGSVIRTHGLRELACVRNVRVLARSAVGPTETR